MSRIARTIVKVLHDTLGEGTFSLHEPSFAENEHLYLQDCISSTYVSSVGAYVDRIEKDLAHYPDRRAVAVVNGTAALQIALQLRAFVRMMRLSHLPTFVATANAACYLSAFPHFVDCDANRSVLTLKHCATGWNRSLNQLAIVTATKTLGGAYVL